MSDLERIRDLMYVVPRDACERWLIAPNHLLDGEAPAVVLWRGGELERVEAAADAFAQRYWA